MVDDLSKEGFLQRMRSYRIECTVYDEATHKPKVIRLNSKKDQRTERYKGGSQDEDPVVGRWDNTGFHDSGNIEVDKVGTGRRSWGHFLSL